MKIKAVLMDMDGTLLDSRARHEVVLQDILDDEGIVMEATGLVGFKRSGFSNVEFLLSKGCSKDQAYRVQREWISKIEEEEYLLQDELYPDTLELIGKYKGWRRVLVTARSNTEGVYKTLDRLGIRNAFDAIYVVPPTDDVVEMKARILCEEKVLLFYGDTKVDYKAACMSDVAFEHRQDGFHSYQTVIACEGKGE